MQNFVQDGSVITAAAPYTRTSGQGAKIGSLFGIAKSDVASGATGEFLVEGVVTHAKTSAQAWAVGDRIYWDDTNKRFDNVSTVGMLVGYATAVAANPSSTGTVRLSESPPGMATGAQTAIADIATVDATDLATSEALANATKAKVNALLAALRTAGILLP
jgi:predicted RecA/RadA family phage recombinase